MNGSFRVRCFIKGQLYKLICFQDKGLVYIPNRCKHFYPRRVSKMFLKIEQTKTLAKDHASKSHQLLINKHFIHPCHPGGFHFLPLALRVLDKLTEIIDEEMEAIGAQKVSLTTLAPKVLWEKTGRWDSIGGELMKTKDRLRRQLCLSPTHEEVITSLVKDYALVSRAVFPLKLYQITRKFRDELRPCHGLLRSREFEMKDLYTFDLTLEAAKETYDTVCEAYANIFNRLHLDFIRAEAAVGNIGGIESHEFHLPSNVGQDTVWQCENCGHQFNHEISMETISTDEKKLCPKCKTAGSFKKTTCIEVGHSFLLGTKYTKPFDLQYIHDQKGKKLFEMGCYGLGVSRILQAVVEVLSEGERIRWPKSIAPYQVCVIPHKSSEYADKVASELNSIGGLQGEVIVDDRFNKSIGYRMKDMRQIGIPYVIVNKRPPKDFDDQVFEFVDSYKNETRHLTETEVKETLLSLMEIV